MTPDEPDDKDSIAQELGWESFNAAPHVVQNNIESKVDGIGDDPFWLLRQRGGE